MQWYTYIQCIFTLYFWESIDMQEGIIYRIVQMMIPLLNTPFHIQPALTTQSFLTHFSLQVMQMPGQPGQVQQIQQQVQQVQQAQGGAAPGPPQQQAKQQPPMMLQVDGAGDTSSEDEDEEEEEYDEDEDEDKDKDGGEDGQVEEVGSTLNETERETQWF